MKGKFVLGILVVTGLLALSSTAAQAGSGGTPSALTSFFVCHSISGANLVGANVDVYSDEVGTPTARTNVTLGQAVLACAQAWLWPAGTPAVEGTDINPRIGTQAFELKCYTAQSPGKKTGQTTLYNAEDVLFDMFGGTEGGTEVVQGTPEVRYVCGPSKFTQ
jgi:hypothetical protein